MLVDIMHSPNTLSPLGFTDLSQSAAGHQHCRGLAQCSNVLARRVAYSVPSVVVHRLLNLIYFLLSKQPEVVVRFFFARPPRIVSISALGAPAAGGSTGGAHHHNGNGPVAATAAPLSGIGSAIANANAAEPPTTPLRHRKRGEDKKGKGGGGGGRLGGNEPTPTRPSAAAAAGSGKRKTGDRAVGETALVGRRSKRRKDSSEADSALQPASASAACVRTPDGRSRKRKASRTSEAKRTRKSQSGKSEAAEAHAPAADAQAEAEECTGAVCASKANSTATAARGVSASASRAPADGKSPSVSAGSGAVMLRGSSASYPPSKGCLSLAVAASAPVTTVTASPWILHLFYLFAFPQIERRSDDVSLITKLLDKLFTSLQEITQKQEAQRARRSKGQQVSTAGNASSQSQSRAASSDHTASSTAPASVASPVRMSSRAESKTKEVKEQPPAVSDLAKDDSTEPDEALAIPVIPLMLLRSFVRALEHSACPEKVFDMAMSIVKKVAQLPANR